MLQLLSTARALGPSLFAKRPTDKAPVSDAAQPVAGAKVRTLKANATTSTNTRSAVMGVVSAAPGDGVL